MSAEDERGGQTATRAGRLGPLVGELGALAKQGRHVVEGLVSRRPPPALADASHAVVFVHGYLAWESVLSPLMRHVGGECRVATCAVSYRPHERFERIVERVAARIEEVAWGGARGVTLVGHSLGGLVARWCVQERDEARLVRRVVLLACPNAGTSRASRVPGRLARVLRPGSDVLVRLAEGRERARAVPHLAVVASDDHFVRPRESAAALDGARVVTVEGATHNAMLYDARVLALVAREVSLAATSG